MRIWFIGDIVGNSGCEFLRKNVNAVKKFENIDVVIANAENSAVGNGITPHSADYILDSGVDALTLGNHSLRRPEIADYLENESNPIIRPANFHHSAPGRGAMVIEKGKYRVGLINIQGNVYLETHSNAFECAQKLVERFRGENINTVILDFHAEATAEKRAMGFFLDGKISAVLGTHTHVQTADEQILPLGTAYITDVGMTGPIDSVLGVEKSVAIQKLKTGLPARFTNPDSPCCIQGVIMDINEETGKVKNIKRMDIR